MQSITPLTASDFLEPVQKVRYKFELYYNSTWVDLTEYLKSISVNPGGPGATAEIRLGNWSAELHDPNGIFNPFHPTSTESAYLRIGRKVRISIGGDFGGTTYYWQRLIGYMNAPSWSQDGRSVRLSGDDIGKPLADYVFREPDNHWGSYDVLDSVASFTETGSSLYDYDDAVDTDGETNTIDSTWQYPANVELTSISEGGGGSTYVMKVRTTSGTTGWTKNPYAASLTKDAKYVVRIKYYKPVGPEFKIELAQTIGSTRTVLASENCTAESTWTELVFQITALGSTYLEVKIDASYLPSGYYIDIDQLSVKACEEYWYRYALSAACNGPYYVLLDGEPVYQGSRDKNGHFDGWLYDPDTDYFYFDESRFVEAGTDNLYVYYYTDQVPENVVADILVLTGYYADRSTALAAMDYTATGITLERVWFEAGTTALQALKIVCERCNYRFWFGYDGTPHFQPAPEVGTAVFTFASVGDLGGHDLAQDLSQIANSITIEGAEQKPFAFTRDQREARYTDHDEDATSIAAYLEHSISIRNDLFQDQTSVEDMCAALLTERKDPKWYATLAAPFNVVPLEVGDTVAWTIALGSNMVNITGVVREISCQDAAFNYKVEVGSWEEGEMEYSHSVTFNYGDESWEVPEGVTKIKVQAWGMGGPPDFASGSYGGGGGGGGAYAEAEVSVTPSETLWFNIPDRFTEPQDVIVWNEAEEVLISAAPGGQASGRYGGEGGLASACVGDIAYDGGAGADGSAEGWGGGGGSSACPTGAGNSATNQTGATAPTGGGSGGDGGDYGQVGEIGDVPGGGAGGPGDDYIGSMPWGNFGKIVIWY